MKRSTKTKISTETEELFEESFSSTVKNPNDEVPLTIQYHMLQHQYEVKTYLQSVKNVIYVAERVPPPHEINEDWVRRNDWIISKALLDSSFQSVLSELINDEFEDDPIDFDDDDNPYIQMMEQAETNFASFEAQGVSNGFSGLSVPDIYAEPQRQFDAYRRAEHERRRANQIRERRRSRLIQHIRDNVLHYCKAIWAQEDAVDLAPLAARLEAVRAQALQSKNFAEVDRLKAALTAHGIEVQMSKEGVTLKAPPGFDPAALEDVL